ncbi:MAG TPA: MFS transporter, partial [Lentisphaeria bacterium]|nr:MFS transporter [Lentisphaeria bacterium]
MFSLLLAMIYLAFISLGLPDALLGAAWPVLYKTLNVPLSFAGIITFIISCGTVVSSLMSDRMTRWLGAGKVTAFSVLLTAVALFGFSISGSFWMLCLWAIPYGLGAGAVDAALNNYVALHYSSRHMNWLHCFWGVGVTISPYIMSVCLQRNLGWQSGYRTVSIIQIVLTLCLFLSLPLWKKRNS